jgi:hypothetical protein
MHLMSKSSTISSLSSSNPMSSAILECPYLFQQSHRWRSTTAIPKNVEKILTRQFFVSQHFSNASAFFMSCCIPLHLRPCQHSIDRAFVLLRRCRDEKWRWFKGVEFCNNCHRLTVGPILFGAPVGWYWSEQLNSGVVGVDGNIKRRCWSSILTTEWSMGWWIEL